MKGYIFDLDGTLLDSMNVWNEIDINFLKKRGIALPQDYTEAISGMSFTETAAYTIKRFNLPDSVESLKREWNSMAAYAYGHTVRMKPRAKEYLLALKAQGEKLAIATSLPAELREPALINNGIADLFHAICGSEEAGQGKSRPDIFLLAAKKLSLSPHDCVVFEDILTAIITAKSAGMTVCAVYDETSKNDWGKIKETADYAVMDWKAVFDIKIGLFCGKFYPVL